MEEAAEEEAERATTAGLLLGPRVPVTTAPAERARIIAAMPPKNPFMQAENEKQGGSADKNLKLLVLCTVFGGEVPVGLRTFPTFPGCKFLFTRSNHAQALIEARYRAGLFAPNFNGWSPSRK